MGRKTAAAAQQRDLRPAEWKGSDAEFETEELPILGILSIIATSLSLLLPLKCPTESKCL